MEHSLVAGRGCGDCNVCCEALTIDEPTLRKPQGILCPNARPDHSCGIYDVRPQTCRNFYCGWRRFNWVPEPLRPDRSGVLLRPHWSKPSGEGPARLGVAITLLTVASLQAEGLAEVIATAVAGGVPTFLHVPGPPGHTAAIAQINESIAGAVQRRDKPAILDFLGKARAEAASGTFAPVVLAPAVAGTDSAADGCAATGLAEPDISASGTASS